MAMRDVSNTSHGGLSFAMSIVHRLSRRWAITLACYKYALLCLRNHGLNPLAFMKSCVFHPRVLARLRLLRRNVAHC